MARQAWEQSALQSHFTRVLADLGRAPAPAGREAERRRAIERLRAYRDRGRFPEHPSRARVNAAARPDHFRARGPSCPVFVDAAGTLCAVADLLGATRGPEAVAAVVARGNARFVAEFDEPEVRDWIAASGFTAEEIARIQPMYDATGPMACGELRGPHVAYDITFNTLAIGGFGLAGGSVLWQVREGEVPRKLGFANVGVGAGLIALPLIVGVPDANACGLVATADAFASNFALSAGFVNVGVGIALLVMNPKEHDVAVVPWVGRTVGASVVIRR